MAKEKKIIKEFVFDPRILISPPFTKCPKCKHTSFGILSIHKSYYEKRCRNCMYPNPKKNELSYTMPLTTLNKKVIYVDQMAISNMMKAINPKLKAFTKIDKVWLQLFERLDTLCKMQLIICPSSDFHQEESMLSIYYDSIKSMYNLLSGGIKFKNELSLKIDQALLSLELFLDNKPFTLEVLNRNSAFNDDINIWQDRIFLTVELNITDNQIEAARKNRDEISEGFYEIFKKWQSSKKTFQEFFEVEERVSLQPLYDFINFIKKQGTESSQIDFLMSPNWVLLNTIQSQITKKLSDPVQILKSIVDYFNSENFKSIPTQRISSYMFAGIARKASLGQKKPPSKGMLTDISIISNYLPYCDAMFLDNECVALLKENPTGDYIKEFKTRLFSINTMPDFLEYLENIKDSASSKHLNKLSEVYGNDWSKPFTTLYGMKGE